MARAAKRGGSYRIGAAFRCGNGVVRGPNVAPMTTARELAEPGPTPQGRRIVAWTMVAGDDCGEDDVEVVVLGCGRRRGAQAPSRCCRRLFIRLSLAIHRKADDSVVVKATQGTLEDGRIRWLWTIAVWTILEDGILILGAAISAVGPSLGQRRGTL